MKKFIITETKPATVVWSYEVEAEDLNQALLKVMEGEVEPTDFDTEINHDEDSQFEGFED